MGFDQHQFFYWNCIQRVYLYGLITNYQTDTLTLKSEDLSILMKLLRQSFKCDKNLRILKNLIGRWMILSISAVSAASDQKTNSDCIAHQGRTLCVLSYSFTTHINILPASETPGHRRFIQTLLLLKITKIPFVKCFSLILK